MSSVLSRINSSYEWVTLEVLAVFVVFSIVLAFYMLHNRSFNGLTLYLIPCALWVVVGNVAHLYVYELNPLENRWVPLGVHLFKDLSGYVAVVIASFVAAQRIDISTPRHPWVPRALELSWLTFPAFFLAACAVAFAATWVQPQAPTNLELSSRAIGGVYRFLIVAPIISYSLIIAYWFVKLFGVGMPRPASSVRLRLLVSAGTYGLVTVWGFAYLAWPFSEPSITTASVQQVALGMALVTGSIAFFPPLRQSTNDREIKRLERDEPDCTDASQSVEGTYHQDYISRWMDMTILLGEMAELLVPERIVGWQLRAARLAIFLSHAPAVESRTGGSPELSDPAAEALGLEESAQGDPDSTVKSYNIPSKHPLKAELEADLGVHQHARRAARLLMEEEPGDWLGREPEWIQVLAIVAVDGGMMPESWSRVILIDENPLLNPDLVQKYEGILYRRENHTRRV